MSIEGHDAGLNTQLAGSGVELREQVLVAKMDTVELANRDDTRRGRFRHAASMPFLVSERTRTQAGSLPGHPVGCRLNRAIDGDAN